jgi:hypothetical protein
VIRPFLCHTEMLRLEAQVQAAWVAARGSRHRDMGDPSPADCQVDCQPLELTPFQRDAGGQGHAIYLHRWTAADGDGRAGKS